MRSWEGSRAQLSPVCPRKQVEDLSSILTRSSPTLAWARELGSEQPIAAQPGTPDPDPAPVSSGFAYQLRGSAVVCPLLSLGNKRARTEKLKFCIQVSKKETIPLPRPPMLARPSPSPSPAPSDAQPDSDWSKSDTRELDLR